MKSILILFISSIVMADVLSIDFHFPSSPFIFSKKSFVEAGEMNVGYFVTCTEEQSGLCQTLCKANTCLVSTDSCNACITSSALNIFAVFRDFSSLFVLNQGSVDWVNVVDQLQNESWRVIDENTILNLFEDTQSEEKYNEAKNRFLASCPRETQKAFLIVDQKVNPQLYICQGTYGQVVYQTQWTLEFRK